jgi:GMP synthase-like glutamine amidotransferase
MRLHYFQHVPFEGPGYIKQWADANGTTVSATKFHANQTPPEPAAVDMLVVMGGPMGVYDETQHPWLVAEKRYIERAMGKGTPVLGICLGAQLLACVLGARVYKNRHKEIGWFRVQPAQDTASVESSLWKHIPAQGFFAFHWHGDTFDLPRAAVRLGSSAACRHQAFLYKNNVLGLQFHLESTPEGIKNLIGNCGSELVRGEYIHPAERMMEDTVRYIGASHSLMAGILDEFARITKP